jgi:hypothetical protein
MRTVKNILWVLALLSFVGLVEWNPTSDYDFESQAAKFSILFTLSLVLELVSIKVKNSNQ